MAHPEYLHPGKALTCFKMMKLYLDNIKKNPTEEKFRKIKIENKAYEERVGCTFGGQNALEGIGFVNDGAFLVY